MNHNKRDKSSWAWNSLSSLLCFTTFLFLCLDKRTQFSLVLSRFLLIKFRLCCDIITFDSMLFNTTTIFFTMPQTTFVISYSIFFSCNIQSGTSHPLIFMIFAMERNIGYNSSFLCFSYFIIFCEQCNRFSLTTRTTCSSNTVNVLHSTLQVYIESIHYLREVIIQYSIQPQKI